ncbi:interferon-induced transmembrane protein [Bacteroides sp. CAG:661]|nr:interferon-induced transmembrane protein [Bacteroides sp. CAG:661]
METNICPKTWMTESILVTLFCCLPFGIIGIINASKVSSLFAQGQTIEAQQASNNAKKWTKTGFFVGIALIIIYLLIYGITIFSFLSM